MIVIHTNVFSLYKCNEVSYALNHVKIEWPILKVPDDIILHSGLLKLLEFVHHTIFKKRKDFKKWHCSHRKIKIWEIHTQISPAQEAILNQWLNNRQYAKSWSQVIQIWHGFPTSIQDVAEWVSKTVATHSFKTQLTAWKTSQQLHTAQASNNRLFLNLVIHSWLSH